MSNNSMPQLILLCFLVLNVFSAKSQNYPSFGSEIDVSISGLSFDAMEPFISADGNYLFFNNLNDGINTKLYYATRVNDSSFVFVGELNGTNQTSTPHLDAVADMDSSENFYWTSTRNYPVQLDNLFRGNHAAGNVTNIGRVHGSFNKNIPGWLVMDHGISYDGQLLYFNNARLDVVNCLGPCETELGIAQKVNDSTFNTLPNSTSILQNINDTNYIYYAPDISSDNLELYYTRYLRDTITASTVFEICVAVRTTQTDSFSIPTVLFSATIATLIEASTLTTDMQVLYYHRKIPGSHKIVMRYRQSLTHSESLPEAKASFVIYPNPTKGVVSIQSNSEYGNPKISVYTLMGERLMPVINSNSIDLSGFPSATYLVKIEYNGAYRSSKLIKVD